MFDACFCNFNFPRLNLVHLVALGFQFAFYFFPEILFLSGYEFFGLNSIYFVLHFSNTLSKDIFLEGWHTFWNWGQSDKTCKELGADSMKLFLVGWQCCLDMSTSKFSKWIRKIHFENLQTLPFFVPAARRVRMPPSCNFWHSSLSSDPE